MIFRNDKITESILQFLSKGGRTDFMIDALSLMEVSVWKNRHLKYLASLTLGN